MAERENIAIIYAGKRFTGKTTTCLQMAAKTGKRIFILNEGSHPSYDHWEHISNDQIKHYRGDKVVITVEDNINEICAALLSYQANAFIVFEDCQKYIPQTISRGGLRSMIIDMRKRNFDLAFMYHTLTFVPPYIASMYNMLVLFKTTDSFDSSIKKFPNYQTIKKKGLAINKHKNIHHCEVIMDYE